MFKPEHSGRKKARAMLNKTGYKTGGHVKAVPAASSISSTPRALATGGPAAEATKLKTGGTVSGLGAGTRLDKRARGGGLHHKKGHTTNVVIAMPNQGAKPVPVPVPMGGGHPPMGGAPGGAPPMPPPGAGPGMAAGAGSLPGGAPGMGIKPPGMKAGGTVKAGFKYPIDDGSAGGNARLEKAKAYGHGALK